MLLKKTIICASLLATLLGCENAQKSSNHAVTATSNVTQTSLQALADNLKVNYRVLENRGDGKCLKTGDATPCFIAELTLMSPVVIDATGWDLYFSQVDPVAQATSDEFVIEHINGDLHRLTPTEQFRGFEENKAKTINIVGRGLVLNETKLMPNYYVVAGGLDPVVIASTKVTVDPETGMEVRPHVAPMTDRAQFKSHPDDKTQWADAAHLYQKNVNMTFAPALVDGAIVPTPLEVTQHDGRLDLSVGVTLQLVNIDATVVAPAMNRLALLNIPQKEGGIPTTVTLVQQYKGKPESYTLEISAEGIAIAAGDTAGALYGMQSVAALVTPGKTDVPYISVIDAPRYEFRGLHVDVARNFHSKELLLKIMDQMAAYKLNKLHLHLGDDEGWRLEVNGLPELTDIGSKRCHDLSESRCLLPQLGSGPFGNTHVDGYYSIEDYQEILRAASLRNIQVIPSFDMPGHSRAVIKAMEARYHKYMRQGQEGEARRYLLSDFSDKTHYESIQFYRDNTINVCMESTYAFIDRVMDEMKAVHAAAGQPLTLYHIGADETAGAWVDSPVCKKFLANNNHGVTEAKELGAYFIERVAGLLAQKGIRAAGWNDGMGETDPAKMPADVQSNLWALLGSDAHKTAHEHANYGWNVVLSTPDILYFDFPQAAHPKEHGYYWGSRETTVRDVYNFMPDNLPVHAEFRTDTRGQPYVSDDRLQRDEQGNVTHEPMKKDNEYVGIQGHIWSETIRSDDLVEYMVFPRLIALAERAWHKPQWAVPYNYEGALYSEATDYFTDTMRAQRDADWNHFANVLAQKVMPKLDLMDIRYRLPTVGAIVENGLLKANIDFPGLKIEYRIDNGEWRSYETPVKVEGKVIEVRSVAPDGKRRGRIVRV